jgi:hypothetical protein
MRSAAMKSRNYPIQETLLICELLILAGLGCGQARSIKDPRSLAELEEEGSSGTVLWSSEVKIDDSLRYQTVHKNRRRFEIDIVRDQHSRNLKKNLNYSGKGQSLKSTLGMRQHGRDISISRPIPLKGGNKEHFIIWPDKIGQNRITQVTLRHQVLNGNNEWILNHTSIPIQYDPGRLIYAIRIFDLIFKPNFEKEVVLDEVSTHSLELMFLLENQEKFQSSIKFRMRM